MITWSKSVHVSYETALDRSLLHKDTHRDHGTNYKEINSYVVDAATYFRN